MRQSSLDAIQVLGSAKASIATVTTTPFDFGTPDDIDLRSTNWKAGCRLLAILHNTTAGTTDTTSWTIQDAPDSSGSIGTRATAVTNVISGALAGGVGNGYLIVEITPQADRPWLRFNLVRASGTTDTVIGTVTLLALPAAL
jgi:hypothetical protein